MKNIASRKTLLLRAAAKPTLRGHWRIMRVDHWFKNIFVIPGIIAACGLDAIPLTNVPTVNIIMGLASICLVASSNYVLNELLDAPYDREHPTKCQRPVPRGEVSIPLAYGQWIALAFIGIALGGVLSQQFCTSVIALWVMGCIYNVPPIRSKDLPYLDVLSEAINNPIRMFAGWSIVTNNSIPPGSLSLGYWMIGSYFMALKRFAELRVFSDISRAHAYRKSLKFYSEKRALVSVMFYGSAAMLCLGAFIVRYRLELVLSFPLIALAMATYLGLSFQPDSPVQRPEALYQEARLMAIVILCAIVMTLLLLIDLPFLDSFFSPQARFIQ